MLETGVDYVGAQTDRCLVTVGETAYDTRCVHARRMPVVRGDMS